MNPFKLLLLVILCLARMQAHAQPHFANDTLAYQKYLQSAPFPQTNMALIQAIWVEMKPKRRKVVDHIMEFHSVPDVPFDIQQSHPEYNPHVHTLSNYTVMPFAFNAYTDPRLKSTNTRILMTNLKWDLHALQDSVRDSGMNVDSVKDDMVRRLLAFDKAAYYKPIFFADIYSRYKGDYRKYVDDLFRKSLITSPRRLRSFTAYARKRMILKDMGFQFTLSLALYELWMKQVKDGTRVLTEE